MGNYGKDRIILRELAQKVSEIAALPVQEEKRRLWRALNGLKPERPMVAIDQICWNEMNREDKLTLRCEDRECRGYEWNLRVILYRWEYFPVDMVVEPYIDVNKAFTNTLFGITQNEDTLSWEKGNGTVSHKYHNQITSMDDVMEKIKMPVISHDAAETNRRRDLASWLFEGVMPVRLNSYSDFNLSIWDRIATWMSVEDALYALIDEPDMMHALVKRVAGGYMIMLDQLESENLLSQPQESVHCTGGYTDDLPAPGFKAEKPRIRDLWVYGMAQMLATVSPDMFDEYEIQYMIPIYERFGLGYYGCCEPLHHKMKQVRRLPHVRKVSMSPWADKEKGAAEIHGDYVFSNKPNPSFVAMTSFDSDLIRKDLTETRDICKRHGCPVEFILKDISTVRNNPERLQEWAKIAMDVALH